MREIMYLYFYIKTNKGRDSIYISNPDNDTNPNKPLEDFLAVYDIRNTCFIFDLLFLLIFYYLIAKMVTFWDFVYIEKIKQVYDNRQMFDEEELKEIEYSYFKA